ncbi:MAG: hypothetical protein ABL898_08560 [Hyphomicrobiaceae bacterium]|nr:hypothetical protein [Hyphomicrobiaceae bacterium]
MNKRDSDYKRAAIEIVEGILRGERPDQFEIAAKLAPLETKSRDKHLDLMIHLAFHFATDSDIHANEPDNIYRDSQLAELKRALDNVREAA